MRQADHEAQKVVYRAYREAARGAVGSDFPTSVAGLRVQVEVGANVHMVEDGAFVDAVIWVPRTALTEQK